jgi:hypothetical protein
MIKIDGPAKNAKATGPHGSGPPSRPEGDSRLGAAPQAPSRARQAAGRLWGDNRELREPERARRIRLPSVKRIERESGKTVSALTVAPDGSRTYVFGEKSDVSGDEIDTPE